MENIVYYSSKNKEGQKTKIDHAATVAGSVAAGAQVSAFAIGKHTYAANMDILFLGCEVHGNGKIPGNFRNLLKKVDPTEVKHVALFSILKNGSVTAMQEAKSILEPKGVKICEEEFSCKGASSFRNKGCPTEEDFKKAREFGAAIISKYRNI